MAIGFWAKLKKPITALAPMANVTDAAFRRMFVECGGRPSVFWTEFVSVEGLLSEGRERLLVDLWFSPEEHPIVAQVFGGKPEQFERVAALVRELGFDGLDINMGCPDAGVEQSGGGAALIKNPALAQEIIRAAKRGAGDMPVSVKTRLGYSRLEEMEAWLSALLEEGIPALTVHLRTRKEMSAAAAHWELAPQITALRDKLAPQTVLLGNGDVGSLAEVHRHTEESGFDGIMVGRAAFGNPWFFSGHAPTVRERLEQLVRHAAIFEEMYHSQSEGKDRIKNFEAMKKHFKAYCSSFDGAKELRAKLMEANNASEVNQMVQNLFGSLRI
jgi:nifR3 family TIM-barrel protein